MKKIITNGRHPYRELFTVSVNTQKLSFKAVGIDDEGNYILHESSTYNMGNAYGSSDDYYILSKSEYEALKGKH